MAAQSTETHEMWVLIGPTASGKTDVALELARREPVEIVSMDSMQVYRGMDIGTAKLPPEVRAEVPHHMIDVLDASEPCSVGRFCSLAWEAIEGIRARGRRPLLVGGAPMYLKGLLWGLMAGPSRDPALRDRLEGELAERGAAALHARLAGVDPQAAEHIHPNDVQRIVRALEFWELTGRPISAGQQQFETPPAVPHSMVGLRRERSDLYERIERRVDGMVVAGLVEEVTALRWRLGPQACQALGYKEFTAYLDGRASLDEAVEEVRRKTRRYAKSQLTWFRHFPQARWLDVAPSQGPREVAERCLGLLRQSS